MHFGGDHLSAGKIIVFGIDAHTPGDLHAGACADGKQVVLVAGGGHEVIMEISGRQLNGKPAADLAGDQQLCGISRPVSRIEIGLVGIFLGIVGDLAQHTNADGYTIAAVGLPEQLVFEIAVEGFLGRASSDAYGKPVGDAVIEPEAERGIVEAEEIIGSAVELAETVLYHEAQRAGCRRFYGLHIDDMRGLERAGNIKRLFMNGHGIVEHAEQGAVLRTGRFDQYDTIKQAGDFFHGLFIYGITFDLDMNGYLGFDLIPDE